MKRFSIMAIALCGVLMLSGPAWALTISGGVYNGTDIGGIDSFLVGSATLLANSGDQAEIDWVNSVLHTSYTLSDLSKTTTSGGSGWYDTSQPGAHAYNFGTDSPEYFYIKIGTGSLGANFPDHFLFQNIASFNWAVVRLSDIGIVEVGRLSHIGSFGQVPEPSTLILLGSGLVGLVGFRRFGKLPPLG